MSISHWWMVFSKVNTAPHVPLAVIYCALATPPSMLAASILFSHIWVDSGNVLTHKTELILD